MLNLFMKQVDGFACRLCKTGAVDEKVAVDSGRGSGGGLDLSEETFNGLSRDAALKESGMSLMSAPVQVKSQSIGSFR